jgi:hypothetical protein
MCEPLRCRVQPILRVIQIKKVRVRSQGNVFLFGICNAEEANILSSIDQLLKYHAAAAGIFATRSGNLPLIHAQLQEMNSRVTHLQVSEASVQSISTLGAGFQNARYLASEHHPLCLAHSE